jgi:proteic killer suppression protein
LERFFTQDDVSGINPQFASKLRRMLTALNDSNGPQGMNIPNYRLHPLRGDRKGQWAVWISSNWRLVFEFEDQDAVNVQLVDYH